MDTRIARDELWYAMSLRGRVAREVTDTWLPLPVFVALAFAASSLVHPSGAQLFWLVGGPAAGAGWLLLGLRRDTDRGVVGRPFALLASTAALLLLAALLANVGWMLGLPPLADHGAATIVVAGYAVAALARREPWLGIIGAGLTALIAVSAVFGPRSTETFMAAFALYGLAFVATGLRARRASRSRP